LATDAAIVPEMASRKFHCIRCDKLTPAVLSNSAHKTDYYGLSTPAVLGEVDAYVSQRSYDNSKVKWEALQSWRRRLKSENRCGHKLYRQILLRS